MQKWNQHTVNSSYNTFFVHKSSEIILRSTFESSNEKPSDRIAMIAVINFWKYLKASTDREYCAADNQYTKLTTLSNLTIAVIIVDNTTTDI